MTEYNVDDYSILVLDETDKRKDIQYKVLKNRFDDDFCSCLIQNEIRSKRLKEILYDI